MTNYQETLWRLAEIVEDRKSKDPKKSYVAKLYKKGRGKICQKVGEEAVEVAIAALTEGKKDVINETADLLFHLSVLLGDCEVELDDVMKELEKRMGQSGLDEKAARKAGD